MFKENAKTWAYLLGTLIMFGILALMTRDFLFPIFLEGENPELINPVENEPPTFIINTNFDYIAQISTNRGNITVDLFEQNSPNNVNNFIYLSQNNYYDNVKFHRLIPGLLIQGGDRNTLDQDQGNDGKGNAGYVLDDEINFNSLNLTQNEISEREKDGYITNPNLISRRLGKYSLVMANDGHDTNGSQFFIVFAEDNDNRVQYLNGRYTVIGEVISGFNFFDSIANIPIDNPTSNSPRPMEDIFITDVSVFTR